MLPHRGQDRAIAERVWAVIALLAMVIGLAVADGAATANTPGSTTTTGPHGLTPRAATPAAAVDVEIKGFAYHPALVTVPAGTRVTWTNRDNAPHTATGISDGIPRSPGLGFGATFTQEFDAPGTYDYFCAYHPNMKGTVVVK